MRSFLSLLPTSLKPFYLSCYKIVTISSLYTTPQRTLDQKNVAFVKKRGMRGIVFYIIFQERMLCTCSTVDVIIYYASRENANKKLTRYQVYLTVLVDL